MKVVRPAMTSREAEVPWESKAKYRAIWLGIVAPPRYIDTEPLLPEGAARAECTTTS